MEQYYHSRSINHCFQNKLQQLYIVFITFIANEVITACTYYKLWKQINKINNRVILHIIKMVTVLMLTRLKIIIADLNFSSA